MRNEPLRAAAVLIAACAVNAGAAQAQTDMTHAKFDFRSGKAAKGFMSVTPTTAYSSALGYGYEPGSVGAAPDKPVLFSIALPEGNYNVTVTLGDAKSASDTTVKAEARRLMLEKMQTEPGKFVTRTFTVNVRTPKIPTGGQIHLKQREIGYLNWDDKLTLEFNGPRPRVDTLEITPATNAVTVFITGDSTVTDQPDEPWAAWGQMLPRFFGPGIAITNYAESGESLRSTLGARRLDKVLSVMKPGDYLFIQFGHNDQKEHGAGVGAFTTYKADLKHFVLEAKKRGGLPVLVTSINRRRFDADGKIVNTLGDYPEAVRQTAQEENVPLIDLNAMSKTLFEALGPEGTLKAFVHYPANTFPGQAKELKDDTHFNSYGAYELARCIVEGIKADKLGLVKSLTDDVPTFDPARPDPVSAWTLPASPASSTVKPDGS
ncbi:MAG: rhamnogalacturonan acetylesterase [Armatimonadota bacterium]|nr:rhamnogalacturonan acetylesterase [Armatimonadota bacterium]